jgi:hypothetical protein
LHGQLHFLSTVNCVWRLAQPVQECLAIADAGCLHIVLLHARHMRLNLLTRAVKFAQENLPHSCLVRIPAFLYRAGKHLCSW